MDTWIAFLRGVNVGGRNILPMRDLKAIAVRLGWENCTTYIQSGNLVFQGEGVDPAASADALSGAIEQDKGFRPPALLFSEDELVSSIECCPFDPVPSETNKLHLHFSLAGDLEFDEDRADSLKVPSEEIGAVGRVLYLYAPDGVGRSKLFAALPELLSQDVTVRNLKTVLKMQAIAADLHK